MAKKRIIITTNKEIYSKLNMLAFSNDVIIKNTPANNITKILNNINRNEHILSVEKIGEYFILKKRAPINFSVYYREKGY